MKLAISCIEHQIRGLQNLFNVVESDEYAEIIEHLSTYKVHADGRIIITGVGKNSHIAAKVSETMASLGLPSFYLNTAHCAHGDFGFISPKDTIIHISRSGNTREMLEVVDYVNMNFPTTVQIMFHCNSNNTMNHCDYELHCGDVVEGDEYHLAPTTSTTTLLCILDTVACTLSSNNGFTPQDFLRFHPGGNLGKSLREDLDK